MEHEAVDGKVTFGVVVSVSRESQLLQKTTECLDPLLGCIAMKTNSRETGLRFGCSYTRASSGRESKLLNSASRYTATAATVKRRCHSRYSGKGVWVSRFFARSSNSRSTFRQKAW